MSPIWVKFLGNWGEITLKIDRFHEAFTQRHKRVCYSQKIYPRSQKFLHGYIRHIRDIFQLWLSSWRRGRHLCALVRSSVSDFRNGALDVLKLLSFFRKFLLAHVRNFKSCYQTHQASATKQYKADWHWMQAGVGLIYHVGRGKLII